MKSWAFGLIILSLFGKLIKQLLPRGEKSAFFPPLRFLLSLALIVALFSPILKQAQKNNFQSNFAKLFSDEGTVIDPNTLILEQMGKTMKKSVDSAFPDLEYTLEIYTDDKGIPNLVKVCGCDEAGGKIADFIQCNYSLKAISE